MLSQESAFIGAPPQAHDNASTPRRQGPHERHPVHEADEPMETSSKDKGQVKMMTAEECTKLPGICFEVA